MIVMICAFQVSGDSGQEHLVVGLVGAADPSRLRRPGALDRTNRGEVNPPRFKGLHPANRLYAPKGASARGAVRSAGKYAGEDGAQSTAHAVYGNGTHGIVDLGIRLPDAAGSAWRYDLRPGWWYLPSDRSCRRPGIRSVRPCQNPPGPPPMPPPGPPDTMTEPPMAIPPPMAIMALSPPPTLWRYATVSPSWSPERISI